MILGTVAVLIAVALNFRHALDDYGVRNNSLHMEILAQSNSVGGGNGSNVGGGGGIPDGGGSTGGGGGSNGSGWDSDGGELGGITVTCDQGRYGRCSYLRIVEFQGTTACTCKCVSDDNPNQSCSFWEELAFGLCNSLCNRVYP